MSLAPTSDINNRTSGDLPPLVTGDTSNINTTCQPNITCLGRMYAETRRNRLNHMSKQRKRRRHYKNRHFKKYRQSC